MLVRRRVLHLIGVGVALTGASRIARTQAPEGTPKLTQLLKTDLQGQGQTVQETVVNLLEMPPSVGAPWHMHPGAQELLYALEGILIVEVEGQRMTTLKAGECYAIPADTPHLARNESTSAGAKALVVHSRSGKDKPFVIAVRRAT